MAFRRPFGNDTSFYRSNIPAGATGFRNDTFMGAGPGSALDINRRPFSATSYGDLSDSRFTNNFGSYGAIRKDPPMFSSYEANNRPSMYSGGPLYPDPPSSSYLNNEEPANKRFKPTFTPNQARGQFTNNKPSGLSQHPRGPKGPIDKPKPPAPTPEKLAALEKSGVLPLLDATGNAFHCYYCDAFCNSLITAECHIESPKHNKHMTEPNEKLQGIDVKFVMKTDKITDVPILKARKEELKKLTEEQKTKYVEQMIRLKNGVGGEAYYCLLCNSPLNSAKVIDPHITSLRHAAYYETHKKEEAEAEAKEGSEEGKKDKTDGPAEKITLEEQLNLVKVPVIGLEHIVEYIDPDNEDMRLYECTLCKVFNNVATVVNHVVGFKHRVNCIKKARPLEAWSFGERTRETMSLATAKAKEIEEADGRQKWVVKNEKPKIPPNISVSPTKKVNLKEINDQINSGEANASNILDLFVNFKLENDNDAQKAIEVVSSLVDALLKYKLSKFPAEMRTVLASKLISEGIKTSIPQLINGDAEHDSPPSAKKDSAIILD